MKQQLALLVWYAKRPNMYRDLVRRIRRKINGSKPPSSNEELASREWCARNCLDRANLFSRLGLSKDAIHIATFEKICEERFESLKGRSVPMGGAGDYELLYALAEKCKATTILETGVASGYSSLAFLMSVSKRNGVLLSSDRPYVLQDTDQYVGHVVPEEYRKFWRLHKRPDRDILPQLLKMHLFDLVHYDSDKSREGRLWAYSLIWPRLKPRAFFVSDDIADNLAFKDFCELMEVTPLILKKGRNYLGILQK